jgi:hypothetical protein
VRRKPRVLPTYRFETDLPTILVDVFIRAGGCRGCSLADGDTGGVYLLEWYGGYEPAVRDSILGSL